MIFPGMIPGAQQKMLRTVTEVERYQTYNVFDKDKIMPCMRKTHAWLFSLYT